MGRVPKKSSRARRYRNVLILGTPPVLELLAQRHDAIGEDCEAVTRLEAAERDVRLANMKITEPDGSFGKMATRLVAHLNALLMGGADVYIPSPVDIPVDPAPAA